MSKKQKSSLIRIIAAGILLIAAALLPLEGIPQLIVFLVPYFIVGWDVLWKAVRNILSGQLLDENFLMSLATVGAMFTSDYSEGVTVMLLYQIGELFQSMAVDKSRRSISDLMDIYPDHANVLRNGEFVSVDPEEVAEGEIIMIRPGERVPLDAVVTEGTGSLNTAALTGESTPRDVAAGDSILSGSVNLNSVLHARVTSVYDQSTVARVLRLVEDAADRKSKAENFITRFAHWYTPAVVIAAVLLAIIPPLAFNGVWNEWIHRALVFLVVSCPCALVISVPLSFFAGIGCAAKNGILVKGAGFLETIADTGTVVFDKTGTLTTGSLSVADTLEYGGFTAEELITYAKSVERFSDHPVAKAIAACEGEVLPCENVVETAGKGIRAVVAGRQVACGNAALLKELGIEIEAGIDGGTVIYTAIDGEYAGCIVVSDTVKPDSREAVSRLKAAGVKRVIMLTGDSRTAAKNVADSVGIKEVYSELLPQNKVEILEKVMSESKGATAFVGDGINDAPTLARADVGVAMGALGSDAAIEAADLVLMDDKLLRLPDAISISRKTMSIVRQNIVFALLVKAVILVLGALGIAGMWLAVFADVGVCVLAILNSIRAMNM